MGILAFVAAVVGGLAYWWWAGKNAANAAGEIVDTAQKVRGHYKRKAFRAKVEGSHLTSVDDPIIATAAFLIGIALLRGTMTVAAEDAIRADLAETIGEPVADDVFLHAKWMAEQTADVNNMLRVFGKLWLERLHLSERADMFGMAKRAAAHDGPPTALQQEILDRLPGVLRLHARRGVPRL